MRRTFKSNRTVLCWRWLTFGMCKKNFSLPEYPSIVLAMSNNSHKRQFICSVTELLPLPSFSQPVQMNTTRFSTGRGSFSNTWWTAIFLLLIITVSDPLNVPSTKCGWGNEQRNKTNQRRHKTKHARRNRPSCFLNHILHFCDCKWWGVIEKKKKKHSRWYKQKTRAVAEFTSSWSIRLLGLTQNKSNVRRFLQWANLRVLKLIYTKFGCVV